MRRHGARPVATRRSAARWKPPAKSRRNVGARAIGSPSPDTICSAGTIPTIRPCCGASAIRRWRCSWRATRGCSGIRRSRSSAAARPTAGGRDNARDFAHAIAATGLGVTSGLAGGIDTAAHEAALAAGGITVAVLGSGIDIPYPRANAGLHARIAASGAVVSEYLPGTEARREHFPRRNRIIAGLALGVLVIEAAERSGALITARLASEAGRDVFAVPGSIHNPMARGCHRLIRDGAGLVESAHEVIAAIAPLAGELGAALRDAPGRPQFRGRDVRRRRCWRRCHGRSRLPPLVGSPRA